MNAPTRPPVDLAPDEEGLFAGARACPGPELLLPARAGTLPPGLQTEVAAHLAMCPACALLAEALSSDEACSPTVAERARLDRAVLATAPASSASPARRPRGAVKWMPWAAAAALVLVASAAALQSITTAALPAAPAPPAPPALPLSFVPTVFVLNRPLVPGNDEPVWRGAARSGDVAGRIDRVLGLPASERAAIRSGLERLVALPATDARSRLYVGVALLYLGRPADAERMLAGGTWTGEDEPERLWYLALALKQRGDEAGARDALARLCAAPGERAALACAGVNELARH